RRDRAERGDQEPAARRGSRRGCTRPAGHAAAHLRPSPHLLSAFARMSGMALRGTLAAEVPQMRVIWLSVATAISGLALVGALGASEAARPHWANASVSAYATTAYGWPLKPFHSPHPVRGNFGDPRMVFDGPPTAATLYRGSGSFSFHRGADIYGP